MRIALYHNLTSGGSKREAYEFARRFVRDGHTVHLFCPSTADESFLPLTPIVHKSFAFDLHLLPDRPGRLPFLRRYLDLVGLIINLRRIRAVACQIAAQIDAGGYDFVFAHHDQLVQSPYLFRFLQSRSVYYCAEPMREFYEPPIPRLYLEPRSRIHRIQRMWYAPAHWLRRQTIQSEDQRNVHEATLLLTNSYYSAESIYRAYGIHARVSYLGVDSDKFRPLNLTRGDFVLSVGAVSPLKGYDFLIQALGCLPKAKRPRLTIVGNTASAGEVNFLHNLAQKGAVTIEILVNVSDDDLVQLYNRARALVYSPVLEPFGFAPLEAMACGTPVVAVKEGGVRESVVDGVTGVMTPRDAKTFASAVDRVLSDCRFARMLGQNGRDAILRFWTWSHAYQRLLDNIPDFARA